MDQLHNIPTPYLWPILIVLWVLIFFVGRKASPDPELLVEGGKYSRPFSALEQEPTAKEQLFKSWDENTKGKLRSALWWDFLFIPIYLASSIVACVIAGRFLASACGIPFTITFVIILLQLLAGLFDVIENVILLRVIDGVTSNGLLTIARVSTVGKFGLIGLGILYFVFGLIALLCRR